MAERDYVAGSWGVPEKQGTRREQGVGTGSREQGVGRGGKQS